MSCAMDYLTADDHKRLTDELESLKGKRVELSDRIGRARELGDLKENADYHAAKDDQGHNERKIRDLEERLAFATVTDDEHVPEDVVFFGATVQLRNIDTGKEDAYRLVGDMSGSFDLDYMEVTPNSAMGMALLKARIGETIGVDLPAGRTRFEVLRILE